MRIGQWVITLTVLSLVQVGLADNWPQWRGPTDNNVAAPGEYPTDVGPNKNVEWKIRLPGKGNSTPIVWEDSIFITCGIDGQDSVVCYDWKGKEQWRKSLGKERPGRHRNATGANSSIITDGKLLYAYFKSGTLAALELDGTFKWKINIQKKYGEDTLWWDMGTSPVLAGGNVVIAVMQDTAIKKSDSFLVAFDMETGDEVWKADRRFQRPKESDQAYTTPMVREVDGKETIIVWGADYLTGHDAATGKMMWKCGDFNPDEKPMWRVIASPAICDGIAVVPYGRGKFTGGAKLGGKGDVTKANRIWDTVGVGADVPTPVAVDGKAYVLTDRGEVVCLRVKNGEKLWEARLPRGSGNYYSSPIKAGNIFYFAREDGKFFAARVNDKGMKVVTDVDFDERIIAVPVPINGKLLLRGQKTMYCFKQ